jgi:S1-C subfamily serine protease
MTNPLTDFSNNLAAAVEAGSASLVLVDARKRYPASGIAFAEDLVLTASHVVTREENIRVMRADGATFSATLAGNDPGSDLALLRLTEKSLTPAKVNENVKVGQLVLALGRPSENGAQASWGIVNAIGGPFRTGRGGLLDQTIQTETTPYPGFSGGALINTEGEVLGLNTSGLTHGSSLTIPAKVAWRIAESLAKHGSVKRGYLGVRTQPVEISEGLQSELKRKQGSGLLIVWLEEDGPAKKGGAFVGDILVTLNGNPVGDPDDIFVTLGSDVVDKSVPVQVVRGGKLETLKVTVGERK